MARGEPHLEHLLRRAAFGASPDELKAFARLSIGSAIDHLIEYERQPDDVDRRIGDPAFVGVTTRGGPFSPNTSIEDARQRWLFRMVHSPRPLQEKMALFWHNHFATAYSKVAGFGGAVQGTKMLALKAGELPGPQGQIELFRQRALGSFRDLLVEMARDPAMLVWLDNRTNTRQRPQENFAREVMELFTCGIGHYTEEDVYAAARVFTGWNLRLVGRSADPAGYYEFFYNAVQHDTREKAFTFSIYPGGSRTIPARAAADGMQDGFDFLTALATRPETARRVAAKLWNFFVSEVHPPPPDFVSSAASIYLQRGTAIGPVVEFILRSRWFQNPGYWHTRYSWPAEFVVRAIKEVGWTGMSIDAARSALAAMGQTLFEPPDVNGWEPGPGWFTTGAMLARMNFAATLARDQQFNIAAQAAGARSSPESLIGFFTDRLSASAYDREPYDALVEYLRRGVTWPPTDAQLRAKAPGLVRLMVESAEYQCI
jgi:uncharacterized protein (DUF1800 family)